MRKIVFSVLVGFVALGAGGSVLAKATKYPTLCSNIGMEVMNAYRVYGIVIHAIDEDVIAGKKPSATLMESLKTYSKDLPSLVAPLVTLYATLECPIPRVQTHSNPVTNECRQA